MAEPRRRRTTTAAPRNGACNCTRESGWRRTRNERALASRIGRSALADQLQPFVLGQRFYTELGGLLRLGPGIGADDQEIGFGRNRAADLGAEALGPGL